MKYKIWQPTGTVKNTLYDILSINDVYDGFFISLVDDENQKLTLTWHGIVVSYMRASEETRFRFISNEWQDLRRQNGDWSFYEVENSDFCAWIQRESEGMIDVNNLHHLMIITKNDVLDVVSYDYPKATSENQFS